MDTYTIEDRGTGYVVKNNSDKYNIREDKVTGDWVVTKHDSALQDYWYLLTESDAIKFSLSKLGILENPNYEMAPDRTNT